MASIDPRTNAPRYADLRKAMEDNVVTRDEVRDLIEPHYQDTWRDGDYRKVITELSNGSTQTGAGTVTATQDAQEALQMVLAWE